MQRRSNAAVFWPVILFVAVLDLVTKAIAVQALVTQRLPNPVWGSALRFTLVYNPGAAFGLHLGPLSRWIFTALTIVALVILARLYRSTLRGDSTRVLALALVCGGAIGNLLDRLRSDLGVVDFIDVGFGDTRWPTFNVADMAVSCGAVLLAYVLWQEDQAAAPAATAPLAGAATADQGDLV
ncbi:MAG: signal peptidase II [Gemmatimonadota bacterium]|nr:signal peptidase II [Gemmatimonadota bacterium]